MNTTNKRTPAGLKADLGTDGAPGLEWAVRRTSDDDGSEVVIAEPSGVSTSATELSDLLEWFFRSEARGVSATPGLETAEESCRLVATAIIDVSSWERERLSARIAWMRAQGRTLEAIADQLNEEGARTTSGEARWRPSTVQAAIGDLAPELDDCSDAL